MKRLLYFPVLLLFISNTLFAQLSLPGTPPGILPGLSDTALLYERMPEVDVVALLAEDRLMEIRGDIPWRFGENIEVALNPGNSGRWQELPDGSRLWRLGISSPGAYSLNLLFDDYRLPEGAELYIYPASESFRDAREYYLGAFTHLNNQADGYFATTLVPGDSIVVEYLEPAGVDFSGRLNISRVTHAYRDPMSFTKGFGDSGYCNVNVACDIASGWEDQINSVVLLLSGGNSFCSGVVVNNTNNDGRPILLSAYHCAFAGNTERNPAGLVAWFNWQSETCEDPAFPPPHDALSGASLLARNSTSDFWLLEMNHNIPESYNPYYAGWNRDLSSEINETIIGIHHPRGDIKKFSYSEGGVQSSSYLGNPGTGLSHWRITWDGGTTTEPGSSGSPIFDSRGRILGQLHGGYAACGNTLPDWYGRFGVSWTGGGSPGNSLSNWLDPVGSSPQSLNGFDPFGEDVEEVASFSASPGNGGEVVLEWEANPSGDPVLIAISETGEFSDPAGYYSINDNIREDGKVIYIGYGDQHLVEDLEDGREYFFRAWSFSKTPVYSKGTDAQVLTICPAYTLPFDEHLLLPRLPYCWQNEILSGEEAWSWIHNDDIDFGGSVVGEYSLFFPGDIEYEGSRARLISPVFDLSGYELAGLSFYIALTGNSVGSGRLDLICRDHPEGEWEVLYSFTQPTAGWELKMAELHPGQELFQVGFEAEAGTEGAVYLDRISVTGKYEGDFPAPFNLSLSGSGNDWVEIEWEIDQVLPGEGPVLEGFGIYRDAKHIGTIDDPQTTAYIDSGLAVGDYEYQVSALYSDPDWETVLDEEEKLFVQISAGEVTYRLDLDTVGPGITYPLPGTYHYNQGAKPMLQAEAVAHSEFSSWHVDSQEYSGESEIILEMEGDKYVEAVFRRNTHSIVLGSVPPGIGEQTGGGSYTHGSVSTIFTSVPSDRIFLYWSMDGNVISTRQAFPYTVTKDAELFAHFSSYIFEIVANVYPGGGGSVSGAGVYEEGSMARLEAIPGDEYIFLHWEEDGKIVQYEQVYEFVVAGDRSLTAVFGLKEYELNVFIIPEAGGSTTPAPGTYSHISGDNVLLEADASNGWTFSHWEVNGQLVQSGAGLEVVMVEDTDVTAVFDREEIVVFPNPASDILNVEWPAGKNIEELRLTDINGHIITRQKPPATPGDLFGHTRIYLPGEAQGLYILTVFTTNETFQFKVVVY